MELLARLSRLAKGFTIKGPKTRQDCVSAVAVIRREPCTSYLLETFTPERVLTDFLSDSKHLEKMFVRDAWEVMVLNSCLSLFKDSLSFWAGQEKQQAHRKPHVPRPVPYDIDTDIDHTTGWSMSQHD